VRLVDGPSFSFAAPGRVIFGAGRAAELPGIVRGLGARPLVLTGSDPARHADLISQVGAVAVVRVAGEPSVGQIRDAVAAARACGADVVVGLGGGAVLDAAKAVAVLAASGTDPLDHLEVVGRGVPLPEAALPWVAVPTTAGTGSEMTQNAVLTSPDHGLKVSLRGPSMLARVALVDPLLTVGCPPGVTASSGLDALTQCLEAFVTPFANPLTDGFCREGLARAGRSLRRAFVDGSDVAARTDLAMCAALSGLALANAKLGAVHGFAGVLGGLLGATHGAVCAALLPATTRVNVRALGERAPGHPALERYAEAAGLVTGEARVESLVTWLDETNRLLGVPGLSAAGLTDDRVTQVCAQARTASSMKGNPIELTPAELAEIVAGAFDGSERATPSA